MSHHPKQLEYSQKYIDDKYEYRSVMLTEEAFLKVKAILKKRLLKEMEWRSLGIQGTPGWEHYGIFPPEPHILLLRKKKA